MLFAFARTRDGFMYENFPRGLRGTEAARAAGVYRACAAFKAVGTTERQRWWCLRIPLSNSVTDRE
jgi:hypothetical protein